MTDAERVSAELRALGYRPEVVRFAGVDGETVLIDYQVEVGRYRDKTFGIGISFLEKGYPEYPPHFLHVRNLSESNLAQHSRHEFDGDDWATFSVPPSDFWDGLPSEQKTMKSYLNRHVTRFWNEI